MAAEVQSVLDVSKPAFVRGRPVAFHGESDAGELIFRTSSGYLLVDRYGRRGGKLVVSNEPRTTRFPAPDRPVGSEVFVLCGRRIERASYAGRVRTVSWVIRNGERVAVAAAALFSREQLETLVASAQQALERP